MSSQSLDKGSSGGAFNSLGADLSPLPTGGASLRGLNEGEKVMLPSNSVTPRVSRPPSLNELHCHTL